MHMTEIGHEGSHLQTNNNNNNHITNPQPQPNQNQLLPTFTPTFFPILNPNGEHRNSSL